EPLPARAACFPWHQASAHRALSTTDQRQGRALPPDDGEGVGLRRRLSLTPRSQSGAATLAAALQRDQTPQRARGPAADQPRSQRAWAGHLGTREPLVAAAADDRPGRRHRFLADRPEAVGGVGVEDDRVAGAELEALEADRGAEVAGEDEPVLAAVVAHVGARRAGGAADLVDHVEEVDPLLVGGGEAVPLDPGRQ